MKLKNLSGDDNSLPLQGLGVIFLAIFVTISISAQKIKHPSLVFTPVRIQQAKKQVKEDANNGSVPTK